VRWGIILSRHLSAGISLEARSRTTAHKSFHGSHTYIPPPNARIPTHTPQLHSNLTSPKSDTTPNALVVLVNGGVDELMARLEETGAGGSYFFLTFVLLLRSPAVCSGFSGSRCSDFLFSILGLRFLLCPFVLRLPSFLWAFVFGSGVVLAGGTVWLRCFWRSLRGILLVSLSNFLGFACNVTSFA
jgi:hypothetical protein